VGDVVKGFNVFWCDTCMDKIEYTPETIKAHLKIKHDIADNPSGTRQMLSHMDATDSYYSTYEWRIKGVILRQEVGNKRSRKDGTKW